MQLVSPAIVLAARAYGENGAIVHALTPADGVRAGFVRGGHGRRLGPVLQPANLVIGEWRARTDRQMPALTVELVRSRAPLHGEPLAAAALAWLAALTVSALPEMQPYPAIHDALAALLDAIEAADAARFWAAGLARYELLLLAGLGFGLDLESCVVTGARDDLAFVSPRSGSAVSRAAATGYERRLLPLPPFLRAGGGAGWPAILDALAITGHFLARDVLVDRAADALAARGRLMDRLRDAAA